MGYKEELSASFLPLCPPWHPTRRQAAAWDPVSLWRVERARLSISRKGQASQLQGRWEDKQGESDGVGVCVGEGGGGVEAKEAGSRRKIQASLQNCSHSR